MRETEARLFTDRRAAGRGTGLATATFFLAVTFFVAGFLVRFALVFAFVGGLGLRDPFFDLAIYFLVSIRFAPDRDDTDFGQFVNARDEDERAGLWLPPFDCV